MCFDTTGSNNGHINVAVSCLQTPLMKLFIGAAFEVYFGANCTILANWGDIDKALYETSVSNETDFSFK